MAKTKKKQPVSKSVEKRLASSKVAAAKKLGAPASIINDLRRRIEELEQCVESLTNEWTGQIVSALVKVDALSVRVAEAVELAHDNNARVDDVVATLTALTPTIAALQKFDQYIYDAVKRHEETYHGELMVGINLRPEEKKADDDQH